MKALHFPEANATLHRNTKDEKQSNTYDLPVCQTSQDGGIDHLGRRLPNIPCSVVCWAIEPKDVERILKDSQQGGAKVWALFVGHQLPPHSLQTENPFDKSGENYSDFVPLRPMPSPSAIEQATPLFEAIWSTIKRWDIRCPEYYGGYTGANGSHVKLIMDAIGSQTEALDALKVVLSVANDRIKYLELQLENNG